MRMMKLAAVLVLAAAVGGTTSDAQITVLPAMGEPIEFPSAGRQTKTGTGQIKGRLVVADTMDLWINIARPELETLLGQIYGLVLNYDEAGLFVDRIVRAPAFRRRYKALDTEAMLTRLPRGYAEGHPAERWLRYKSFTATRALTARAATSARLPAMLERDFAALVPLVRWLNGAIGYKASERRY